MNSSSPAFDDVPASERLEVLATLRRVIRAWPVVLGAPLLAGALAFGIASLVPKTYTARTTFLPPQQQQSMAASALSSSLGALAGLAGVQGIKTPADEYVSLMQSDNVTQRVIEKFDLRKVYDERYLVDTREKLAKNARFSVGKKDGIITVEVDDHDPQRAADMANAFVAELRRLSGSLALTEAQQRRAFFETQLKTTRDNLAKAEQALQASGFSVGALKVEPKAVAEGYARLRAEVTAGEVRLQSMRTFLRPDAAEIRQAEAALGALKAQLSQAERNAPADNSDYIPKYREFKYQETLFELFARQYELAHADESREGPLLQVVDPASPPEKASKPKRGVIAALAAAAALLAALGFAVLRGGPRA